MSAIYLDYNATTPIHPEVARAMEPFLRSTYGNPSSAHSFGVEARLALESARTQVASLIGAKPDEIVFTSGGTESNNLAIKGVAWANRDRGNHIVTSIIEHPAVTEVCRWLSTQGFRVTTLPVDESGRLDPDTLERACGAETILVSVMLANNELGTVQPIGRIAEIAHAHGAVVHTDAAQAVGKIETRVDKLGVDLLSIAGHKLYAPKGVGALFVRAGTNLAKTIHGADHERGLRPGTENVLLTTGLGCASEIAMRDLETNARHMVGLRDRLETGLEEKLSSRRVKVNGRAAERLPNTASVSFHNVDAATLLAEIGHQVAASAGAACHEDDVELSHVLQAIDLPIEWAMGTVRFSVGRESTDAEIDEVIELVAGVVKRLQGDFLPGRGAAAESDDSEETVFLTRYTKGLGCACKIRPQALEKILTQFGPSDDQRVLVDMMSSDDAAVFQLSEDTAIVQTADFLTPIVDDPYEFGQIAAANSLSDIYAMGGTPIFALNIVGFPTGRLPISVLNEILRGSADKCAEAEVSVLGGHSVEDSEPKFGLSVTGLLHPERIWRNSGAQPGDILILTKPIGTGLIATGMKRGVVEDSAAKAATLSMTTLNAVAALSLADVEIHACTDITGFGLLGHLHEMLAASGVDAEIWFSRVPVLYPAVDLAEADMAPGGTRDNLAYVAQDVTFDDTMSVAQQLVLADAQTSGGLLVAVSDANGRQALDALHQHGVSAATAVGRILDRGSGRVSVAS